MKNLRVQHKETGHIYIWKMKKAYGELNVGYTYKWNKTEYKETGRIKEFTRKENPWIFTDHENYIRVISATGKELQGVMERYAENYGMRILEYS